MATFSAVNNTTTTLSNGFNNASEQEHTATEVRTNAAAPEVLTTDLRGEESSPNTPTRHSFGGVLGQRPLPDGPLTPARRADDVQDASKPKQSKDSAGDGRSQPVADMEDVDMENGEDEGIAGDDDGSGNESATSETQRPSKKKKGQRFFCTDFPPCQLSFTRSEHLARHIRKHTGERPFQCHCSRRFSRLDNLRQHAQTVHVNEEIPGDSLAAQSTRFQRQIRTDRVRPTSSRSRASTVGSQGGHSRGHSRNLSTSSIGSTTSSIGIPDEGGRRRPQPLAMANDTSTRARPLLDAFSGGGGGGGGGSSSNSSSNMGANPGPQYAYYNPSSSGYSTPISTAFSTGNVSPQHPPAIISPSSTISRSSFFNSNRTHARRLSVPSTQHPYQTPAGSYPPPGFSPMTPTSNASFSPTTQVFASPTSSVFSHSRRDSESEMDFRRRTWHPSTNPLYMQRPATSGLTYHQTPDEPRPAFTQQAAASQMTRLPGIESFDHAPPPASRQQPPSPMMIDAAPRPPSSGRPSESGLQQGLTRLDIATGNAGEDQSQLQRHLPPTQGSYYVHSGSANIVQFAPPQRMSMPEQPVTPRKAKRNAWYGGPVGPITSTQVTQVGARTSPEDSGSSDGVATPSTGYLTNFRPGPEAYSAVPVLSREQYVYQTNAGQPQKITPIRSDSGFHGPPPQDHIQQQHHPTPAQQTYALQSGHDPRLARSHYHQPPSNDMTKLEALVAVAASQNRAVEHTT